MRPGAYIVLSRVSGLMQALAIKRAMARFQPMGLHFFHFNIDYSRT